MSAPIRLAVVSMIFGAFVLSACETIIGNTPDAARTALRAFCVLHRAEITHVLLTPTQIQAGHIVCAAVGLALGSD